MIIIFFIRQIFLFLYFPEVFPPVKQKQKDLLFSQHAIVIIALVTSKLILLKFTHSGRFSFSFPRMINV